MKLGQIKIEALRAMFAGYDLKDFDDYSSAEFNEVMYSDQYKSYYLAMRSSIQRCLHRITQEHKVPVKKVEVEDLSSFVDIETLLTDNSKVYEIERVAVKSGGRFVKNYIPFESEDYKTIKASQVYNGCIYVVYYYPMPEQVPNDDNAELHGIREDVQALIPLWIKGELYEEDEPQLAVQAMNMFEAKLFAIEMASKTIQTQIEDVFGGSY